MIKKPVKWETEIGKMELPCSHEEVEYDFDYSDGYPLVTGAQCLDCGKDITDELSDAEIFAACEEEAENIITRQIEAAMDYESDMRAGLL